MSDTTTPKPTASNDGREPCGRFAKGNPGGPGNPFARKTAALRVALLAAVTEQDIQEIAAKLRTDAMNGDKAAIKLLFQYVIGKPQPAVDPDTLDVQEMRGYMAAAFPPEVLEQMQNSLPLSMLLKTWPFFLFAQEQANAAAGSEEFAKGDERERRRAERAQKKAERKQRRQEALDKARQRQTEPAVAAPSPNRSNGQVAAAKTEIPPSGNGNHGANGVAPEPNAPTPNGNHGAYSVEMILNWLRRRRESSDGSAQS